MKATSFSFIIVTMKKLILLGDSTCAIKDRKARPETGWGEEFYPYLDVEWTLLNEAKNGRSTLTCLKEGIFSRALMEADEGDSVIIQFGHNDQKKDERGTDPFSGYIANLKYMASAFMEKGVHVFFITSVPRHKFENGRPVDSHKDYIVGMKTAGHQLSVPVLDITIPLMMDLAVLGEEESRKYYMNFPGGIYENFPEGKEDNTHLRPEGAKWVAREIARQLGAYSAEFLK